MADLAEKVEETEKDMKKGQQGEQPPKEEKKGYTWFEGINDYFKAFRSTIMYAPAYFASSAYGLYKKITERAPKKEQPKEEPKPA